MAQILIVDDDPAVRSVLRRMLAREGHQVDGIEFPIHVEAVAAVLR